MAYRPLKKHPKIKIKPKRQLWRWWRSKPFWAVVLTGVICGVAAYNIFFSPFFQIGEVLIYSNSKVGFEPTFLTTVARTELSRNVLFLNTRSIFLLSPDKIEKKILENFPSLAKVEVKRKWPDAIALLVQEREAKAVWCSQSACFLIDGEGVIFEEALDNFNQLIIRHPEYSKEVNLGKQVLSEQEMAEILTLRDALRNELQMDIPELAIVSPERINVLTPDGWEAYFNFPVDDLQWQIMRLKLVLQEQIPAERKPELKYIDLRFSKVYYKYTD